MDFRVRRKPSRQGVRELSVAMAAVDCLVDNKFSGSTSIGKKQKPKGSKKKKAIGKPSDQVKGEKGGMDAVLKVGNVTTTQNVHQASKSVGCFICQGPYQTQDCPRMEELSTL